MDACQPYTISLYSSSSRSSSSLIVKGTIVPIGECVYAVDDNTWNNVNTGICATTSTDLTITQHVMVSESTPVIVNGYYDWLIGSAVDYQSNGCYDQYNYNSIIAALEALHSDTTYISNKTMPTSANAAISATQIALLDSLISDGLLTLYKQRLTVTIYDSVTYFTVYPYHSTTTPDGVITGMDLCKTPWTIKIPLSDKAPWLRLGKQNETFVKFCKNSLHTCSNITHNRSCNLTAIFYFYWVDI